MKNSLSVIDHQNKECQKKVDTVQRINAIKPKCPEFKIKSILISGRGGIWMRPETWKLIWGDFLSHNIVFAAEWQKWDFQPSLKGPPRWTFISITFVSFENPGLKR